jgi:hypothetical protein
MWTAACNRYARSLAPVVSQDFGRPPVSSVLAELFPSPAEARWRRSVIAEGVAVFWARDPCNTRPSGDIARRVHSPVAREADCRSAGPWFKAGPAFR